jgi:hypothetical protein
MRVTPQVLNDAMRAYVMTVPNRKQLVEHISKAGLVDQTDEIVAELDRVLRTAEDHLYGYPGGVSWTDTFKRDYDALLTSKHPWLSAESLDHVHSFSGWLCWHEGLNATV